MAFVFDATLGGATANSYCTVEFADDYLAGELYADEWTVLNNSVAADLLKKKQALVKATRRLERYEYKGHRSAYTGQRLKHPRYGLTTPEGFYYSANSIIEQMKMATAELALYYLKQDPTAVVDESLRQFTHLRIAGAVELEMRDQLPSDDRIPERVVNIFYEYILSGPGMTRLVRC